jgi:hypothetical protein
MGSLAQNTVRTVILGLMMVLSAVSFGYCDTYDADPYDDVPPVTLELNFVVPVAHAQTAASDHHYFPVVAEPDRTRHFAASFQELQHDTFAFQTLAATPVSAPLRT